MIISCTGLQETPEEVKKFLEEHPELDTGDPLKTFDPSGFKPDDIK